MVCPFQHAIDTLFALVVLHVTDALKGAYPEVGVTKILLQVDGTTGGV